MLAFLSVDLLTDFSAFFLTDFIDWRYIHSLFVFSTQLVNCCSQGRRNYTLLVYCCPSTVPSLWHPSPSPSSQCTVYMYRQCVTVGVGGVLKCTVDHILQEFYTLFLTRFRTHKIATPPQTKLTSKDDIKGFVSLKFLRLCLAPIKYCYKNSSTDIVMQKQLAEKRRIYCLYLGAPKVHIAI
jgi:hypothetical protein